MDTRSLKFKILLESNPQVLDDLNEKFKEATATGQALASSVNIGLSVSLWDMAFDQVRKFPEALAAAAEKAKQMARQMQAVRRELDNLSGGSTLATARLEALLDLADHPGWELPGLAQGAATLDGLSSGALSTAEELKRAGDIATGVGRSFQEVAMAAGQAYEAAFSGQDLNGPLMALAQMGAISGETKAELIALQKAGASGPEIWEQLSASLSRFDGELDKLRNTAEGAGARLDNLLAQVLGRAGQAYLDETTGSVRSLGDALEEMDTAALEHVAEQIGKLMSAVNGGLEVMARWNAELIAVAKVFTAIGLITAARKFSDLAARAWEAVRAQTDFNRALSEAARRMGVSRRALLAHIRDQDRQSASTTRATQVREVDTRSLAANTAATLANTRAKAANAVSVVGANETETLSAGQRTARDLSGMGSPVARTGVEKAAATLAAKNATRVARTTTQVGRLTRAFRGLGGILSSSMRGITAFLGGPIGVALLAATAVKAGADWWADKTIARLDAQEKLENSLARQNDELNQQLRSATSLQQLGEVRSATEKQLEALERKKKDASEDTLALIEMIEQAARARLKLIDQEGGELVKINTQVKAAAEAEERRNAAIQKRLADYEANRERYASEMKDYQWDRSPDEKKLEQLAGEVSRLQAQYAAANGGKPVTDMMAEMERLQKERPLRDSGQMSSDEAASFEIRDKLWNDLMQAQKKYESTRDSLASSDQSARDRAFALEQIEKQFQADQARLAGNEALAEVLEDQLRLARETREIVAATGKSEAEAAEIAQQRLETEKARSGLQEARARREALLLMIAQYNIDQARLAGHEKLAQRWEEELRLKKDIAEIMEKTGMSEQQAAVWAQRRLAVDKARAAQDGGSRAGGKGGQADQAAQNKNLSLAERARRGLPSYTRTGAASVGMTPGWMDTAEDRMLGRNAFAPRPYSVSATLSAQLGGRLPQTQAEPAPSTAPTATGNPAGEKIAHAAEGAAAQLELVEQRTAAAVDQLGRTCKNKLETVFTRLRSVEAQVKDLRN